MKKLTPEELQDDIRSKIEDLNNLMCLLFHYGIEVKIRHQDSIMVGNHPPLAYPVFQYSEALSKKADKVNDIKNEEV